MKGNSRMVSMHDAPPQVSKHETFSSQNNRKVLLAHQQSHKSAISNKDIDDVLNNS